MALYATNLTSSPITLAASSVPVTIPVGGIYNVTSELQGLSPSQYASLEVQRTNGFLTFTWDSPPIYITQGLTTTSLPSLAASYMAQINWFIDPANLTTLSNDINDGLTSSTPLRTWAEFRRRMQLSGSYPVFTANKTITFLSAQSDESDEVGLAGIFPSDVIITIQGTRILVRSGTITSRTGFAPATNTPEQITDIGVTTWELYDQVEITSGATALGSVAWVSKDLGSGAARMTLFSDITIAYASDSSKSPGVGNTYSVYDVPRIYMGVFDGVSNIGNPNFIVKDFELFLGTQTGSVEGSLSPHFKRCRFITGSGGNAVTFRIGYAWIFQDCLFRVGVTASSGRRGQFNINCGGAAGVTIGTTTGTLLSLNGFMCFDTTGTGIAVQQGGRVDLRGQGLCGFDVATTGTNAVLLLEEGSVANLQASLWGTGTNQKGFVVRAGARAYAVANPTYLTITGTGTGFDYRVGYSSALALVSVRKDTWALTGSINQTWANFLASYGSSGFNGYILEPASMAGIMSGNSSV